MAKRTDDGARDVELLGRMADVRASLEREVGRRIIGQTEIIEKLMITLLAGGHALLVGVASPHTALPIMHSRQNTMSIRSSR
jgi:MoxR-like ATPase